MLHTLLHFWAYMPVLWALSVRRDSRGCQHPAPPCRPPQAAASSRCPSLSAPSCSLQDLPPATLSTHAFPHQTGPNSGCGAFSCLQAVLEDSFALSTEITWGIADPFPGYRRAVSPAVRPILVSHPDSSIYHSLAGTPVCLHGGLERPWCPECALCVCKNRAGVQLPAG